MLVLLSLIQVLISELPGLIVSGYYGGGVGVSDGGGGGGGAAAEMVKVTLTFAVLDPSVKMSVSW